MKREQAAQVSAQEIGRQKEIMARVRAENSLRPTPPTAFVDTYGCQQNEADSELLRGMLDEMGYVMTGDDASADVVMINTCAVREHAELRVLGNVGALTHTKKKNPQQIIAICGCMAQEEGVAERIKRSFRHVDLVFGTHALWRFPELLEQTLCTRARVFCVENSDGRIFEGLPVQRDGSCKAWLSIMYGCNNFCSYCIVPYVRGRERSRALDAILSDARTLISQGVREITLLGQNVNSYGRDLDPQLDFSTVLKELSALEGDFLIRFMTSHPKDATPRLFDTMAACTKVAHHIHLPFQAGNDRVLRAMNRGYTRAQYLSLIDYARQVMPDIVITSDVIVGFPGETDAEFDDTLELVSRVGYDALFTFIYSKRPGTPAAEMPDSASKQEKQARFDKLIALQTEISRQRHAAYVGKTLRVLIDGEGRDDRYSLTGRTNGGRLVHLSGERALVGSFRQVKITDGLNWALIGELAE